MGHGAAERVPAVNREAGTLLDFVAVAALLSVLFTLIGWVGWMVEEPHWLEVFR